MILLLALLVSVQTAGPAEYPPDADCQMQGDGSTTAMAACLKAQAEAWERRLDAEYRGALARGEVDAAALRRGQKAWLRYREANCAAYASVNGTIRTILAGRCWRDMTRDRTLELREMRWAG